MAFNIDDIQRLLIIFDLSYGSSIISQHPSFRLAGSCKHREYCDHTDHKEDAKRRHCSVIINSDDLFVQILLHHLFLLDHHLLLYLSLLPCHLFTLSEVGMQVFSAVLAHQALLVDELLVQLYLALQLLDVEAMAFSGLLRCHSVADLLLTLRFSFRDLFGLDVSVQSFLLKL